MTQTPTITGYRNLTFIGEGGMGIVYRAERRSDGRLVAIKMLKKDLPKNYAIPLRQRMRRELEVCKNFAHPYLVKVLDGGNLPELGPYFVMEYLEGLSLEDGAKDQWLSPKDCKRVTEHMAEAMAYYSAMSVLHRDIKPSNIFLAKGSRTVLLDFGLVHRADFHSLTGTGDRIGTFCSMAPEQVLGQDVDFRSDVYGLGVALYYAATKNYPRTFDDLVALVNGSPFPPVKEITKLRPDFPPELANIIEKCLCELPEKRFENAEELIKEVERLNHTPSFINDEPLPGAEGPCSSPPPGAEGPVSSSSCSSPPHGTKGPIAPLRKSRPPEQSSFRSNLPLATICLLLLFFTSSVFMFIPRGSEGSSKERAYEEARKVSLGYLEEEKSLTKEEAQKLGTLLLRSGANKRLELPKGAPATAVAHLYLAQLAQLRATSLLSCKHYLTLCRQEPQWVLNKERAALRQEIIDRAKAGNSLTALEDFLRSYLKENTLSVELHYCRLFLAQLLIARGQSGDLVEGRNLLQVLLGKDGPLVKDGRAATLFFTVLRHFSSKEEKYLSAQDVTRLVSKVEDEYVPAIYLLGAQCLLVEPVTNEERTKAMAFLERALASGPNSEEKRAIKAHLAEQYFMRGDLKKSLQFFNALPNRAQYWRYHQVRGRLAVESGDLKGALQADDEAIKLVQDENTKKRLKKHRQRTALKLYTQSKKDIR